MAHKARRPRPRAAVRKAVEGRVHEEANTIAQGVYYVARETLEAGPRDLPVPVQVFAPIAYAAEMMAAALVKQHELPAERWHDVTLYLLTGVQEVLIAAYSGFDVQRFEEWMAAEALLVARREGVDSG